MLDLLTFLKDSATDKGWQFECVNRGDKVFVLDDLDWTDGVYKLIMQFTGSRPIMENQRRNGRYAETIELSLCRKFDIEAGTTSDVDESFQQKYDNRLSELRTDLDQFLLDTIDLHPSIEEISTDYQWALNVGAVGVDMGVATLQLETW